MLGPLNHPNVVKLLGFTNDVRHCLVYDHASEGSLDELLKYNTAEISLCADKRLVIARQVAAGLAYLHDIAQLAHRDVKSANILIDDGCIAKLCDFGLATAVEGREGKVPLHSLPSDPQNAVGSAVRDALPTMPRHCLLYTSPSPRDRQKSRMPSSA